MSKSYLFLKSGCTVPEETVTNLPSSLDMFSFYILLLSYLTFSLVYNESCFCPSDCESTQYVFETSAAWRTPRDTALLIKSYSKKNKLLDNVKKEMAKLDALCITPEEKEKRIQEIKQLNRSIAFASTMIQFFWKQDTMVSYVREQHYTIVDMLGILPNNFIHIN